MAAIPAALSIGSGLLSGFGGIKANAENKARKKELGFRIGGLQGITDPVQKSLVEGWSPGGFLRKQTAAAGRGASAGKFDSDLDTARNNAWRFGGAGSGRFLGGVDRATQGKFLRDTEAQNRADLLGEEQLARIFSSIEGSANAFPVELARNPYAGISQGINQF